MCSSDLDTATTEIYTLSLHVALPIYMGFEQIEELRNKQRNIILSEMESSLQAEIDLSNHIEAVVSATSRQQDVQIKKIRQTRRKEQEKVHKDFTKEAKLDD